MDGNVLLVIGNGFDLSLGLRTSYAQFMESSYFPKTGTSSLCSFLRKQYRQNMGWIDIEKELANYSQLITRINPNIINENERWGTETFRREYEELKLSLKCYLDNVMHSTRHVNDNSYAMNLLNNLCYGSKIISFNYTDTIERLKRDSYSTANGNLLHIHGSLAPTDDIVFGVEDTADLPQEHVFLYKAYSPNKNTRQFTQWLYEADKIIFFGYSLGDTDRQYFLKYFSMLSESDQHNMDITFYYYGRSAYDNLKWQLQMLTSSHLSLLEMYNHIKFIDCFDG